MYPANGKWLTIAVMLSLSGGLPMVSHALSTDRDKPVRIEANSAKLDEKKGFSRYEGNVNLQQGSLELHGDSMTVYSNGRSVTKVIVTGSPARFSQRPDGKSADLNAEAGRMEYNKTNEHIILTDGARIWQQGGNEFASDHINYDIRNNIVNAGGDNKENRVSITLQPGTAEDKKDPSE